jgi:hypothetical protein
MKKLVFVACMLAGPAALADNPQQGAPVKAPPKGGDMMPAPKPAPELKQLDPFVGTFHCDMHAEAMMGMPAHDVKGTWTGAWALDNFWVSGSYTEDKPGGMKANMWQGYDPQTKMLVGFGFSTWGSTSFSTSKGWEGDNLVWNETMQMGEMKMESRTTFTKDKSGKTMGYKSEMKDKDGSFKVMEAGKCSK